MGSHHYLPGFCNDFLEILLQPLHLLLSLLEDQRDCVMMLLTLQGFLLSIIDLTAGQQKIHFFIWPDSRATKDTFLHLICGSVKGLMILHYRQKNEWTYVLQRNINLAMARSYSTGQGLQHINQSDAIYIMICIMGCNASQQYLSSWLYHMLII